MDLPVGVLTSKLIGRFIEIDADDPGEALPAAFHIEIHPSVSFTRHTAVPVGVSLPVIYATLNAEGYLMEKGGNESGIIVLASDDAGSEVQGITYTFVLSSPGLNESFTVYAEAGVDFDVVSALRVPESSNELAGGWLRAVADARAAADRAWGAYEALVDIEAVQGPAGPQGPVGPAGAAGPAGPKGDRGERGADGADGPAGLQGERGLPGADGPTGPQGDVGPAGIAGPKGDKGDRGDAGPQGVQGLPGVDGATGPVGADGPRGERGLPGGPGAQGEPGPQGEPGERGLQGIQGERGPAGADSTVPGPAGANGQGVPTGGTTGQVLAKTSGSNYATAWVTPTGGSFGLTGPGRPDVPAGTGLATEIAAAPVGTLYNSTDGAGAGAWAWRKRPAGWVVVDGDTGLRRFVLSGSAFPANASYVEYRRRQDAVSFQINSTNAGAWRINAIPSGGTVGVLAAQPGFRPSSGAMAELNSDGRARLGAFLMQLPPNDGGGALQIRPFEAIAANGWVRVPLMTWLTLDDWPATLPGIAV